MEYRTTDDHYNFDLRLIKPDKDTVWQVLGDGWCSNIECPFNAKNAQFETRYSRIPSEVIQDTLMTIKYRDFGFRVEEKN